MTEIQYGLKNYLPPRRDVYIPDTTHFFISKCAFTRGWDDYRFGQQGTVVHEQLTSLEGVNLFHCSPQSLKNALTSKTFKTRLLLLKAILLLKNFIISTSFRHLIYETAQWADTPDVGGGNTIGVRIGWSDKSVKCMFGCETVDEWKN